MKWSRGTLSRKFKIIPEYIIWKYREPTDRLLWTYCVTTKCKECPFHIGDLRTSITQGISLGYCFVSVLYKETTFGSIRKLMRGFYLQKGYMG